MSGKRPVYARVLRLRYLRPGGLLCFLYFEGSVALGVLLALAELAPWWGIVVLPLAVAAMVKLNDIVGASHARLRTAPAHVRQRPPRPGPVATRPGTPGIVRASVPMARVADTPPPARLPSNGHAAADEVGYPLDDAVPRAEHDTQRRGPNHGRFD